MNKSMWMFCLSLFMILLCPSQQETPQYTFSCMEDGMVVLRGFSANSEVQLTEAKYKNQQIKLPSGCMNALKADTSGHIAIPSKCSNGTDSSEDRTLTIISRDTIIDSSTISPLGTSKPSVSFSAGQDHHSFTFTCKAITNGGVKQHAIGHIGVGDVAPLPNSFDEIQTIEMRFKSEKAGQTQDWDTLPDISTVFIGDKFYMYLKYKGSQKYKISPEKCIALGSDARAVVETGTPNNLVELWNYDSCASSDSINYHLMRNFVVVNDKSVYVEMYGFNFVTNGDITIQCDVTVCRQKDNSHHCDLNPSCSTKATWRRKRRSGSTRTVKTTGRLHVRSKTAGDLNGAGVLTFGLPIFFPVLFSVIF